MIFSNFSKESKNKMLRVDGSYLIDLGTKLGPLERITYSGAVKTDVLYNLIEATTSLRSLLMGSIFNLRTAYLPGNTCIERLDSIIDELINDPDKDELIEDRHVHIILQEIRDFKSVLRAEFQTYPLYLATPKRGYDIGILTEAGNICFPEDLKNKVPEAVEDITQGTRCIAFELFTASGFHLHRANETVLRKYWNSVKPDKPINLKNRTIGGYLKAMEDNNLQNEKLISSLRDLKDLHRNPLIHPNESIENLDDAISLMNTIQSVMTLMLKDIHPSEQNDNKPVSKKAEAPRNS